MIEDIYRLACERLRTELASVGVPHQEEDGDLLVGNHRLALSLRFDGFIAQGNEWLAPLEIQMAVDHFDPGRFAVGVLGVGRQHADALRAAIDQWWALAARAVLASLDPRVGGTRVPKLDWGGWTVVAGEVALRGRVPSALRPQSPLLRGLLETLAAEVADWTVPPGDELKSLAVVVSWAEAQLEVQGAVDGLIDPALTQQLQRLPWPRTVEPWLFKQMFLAHSAADA